MIGLSNLFALFLAEKKKGSSPNSQVFADNADWKSDATWHKNL